MDQLANECKKIDTFPCEIKEPLNAFIKDLRRRQIGNLRILFYVQKLRKLHERVGLIPFDVDTVGKCVDWVLSQDYKQWTVTGYKTAIGQFYRFVHGDIPKEIKDVVKIKKPSARDHMPDLITEDEVSRMVRACVNPRDALIIQVLYDSGIRAGELMNLKVMDVEFTDRAVRLKTDGKTGKRIVILKGESELMLKDYIAKKDPGWPLFPRMDNPKERTNAGILAKIINSACKRAGVRHVHPHLFRHSYASRMARFVSESALEQQLGWVHGSSMSGIYVHFYGVEHEESILRAMGVQMPPKIDVNNSKWKCERCGADNPGVNSMCHSCGQWKQQSESIVQMKAEIERIDQGMKTIEDMKAKLEKAALQLEKSTAVIEDLQKENAMLKGKKP